MSSRAAILRQLNAPLSVEPVAVPAPGPGQAIVRIKASGICHTQLSEARGRRGEDKFLPHLLGHEAAGIVEAIGPEVTRIQPGDHVVLSWIKGRGKSVGGAKYQDAGGKTVNSGPISTFAERAVISEDRITPVPKELPFDLAALLGCAVPTGAGAVLNTAQVKAGQSVVVFGAGGIGLNAIQAAAFAGASPIIAVDIHDPKLTQARVFGATHALNGKSTDVIAAIKELTGGRGADVAIESAGQKLTMEQAFACIRAGGGIAVLIGNLPAGQPISIDPFQLICGKRIVGCWGGDTDPVRDIPRYAEMFLSGKLKLNELVSHRFNLDQINEALDALERGEVARAILEL